MSVVLFVSVSFLPGFHRLMLVFPSVCFMFFLWG